MKKTLTIISSVVFVALISFVIYSCAKKDSSKPSSGVVPDDLLQAAKTWQAIQTKTTSTLSISVKSYILQPVWKAAKIQALNNGKTAVIVASPVFSFNAASKMSGIRKFVFTSQGGQITGGNIIETIADPAYMAAHQDDLIENLTNGNANGFTGTEIIYDVNYNYVSSAVYQNGIKVNQVAHIRGRTGLNNGAATKTSLGNPISTLDYCIDWYDVGYDGNTGEELYDYYLFSTCTGDGSGYGDGGGGGGGTTTVNGATVNMSNVPAWGPDMTQSFPGSCAFMNLEIVSDILGVGLQEDGLIVAYATATGQQVTDVEANGINTTVTDYSNLTNFASNYFNVTSINVSQIANSINLGNPCVASMITGFNLDGSVSGHEVTIYGYYTDSSGTTQYNYIDTSNGTSHTNTGAGFGGLFQISKK